MEHRFEDTHALVERDVLAVVGVGVLLCDRATGPGPFRAIKEGR